MPKPEFPRKFVPTNIDFSEWEIIEPLMQELSSREIQSKEDLETWLMDQSELSACFSEARAQRYIRMTCNTKDEEAEQAYLHFIENVVPKSMPFWHEQNEKFASCPFRNELDQDRYGVMIRNVEVEIEIYREENIPLNTEDDKLSQTYQKRCGEMTVQFDGKEQTLPQMGKYLEMTDRSIRQGSWETVSQRRAQNREEFDGIFNQLIEIRDQTARNADSADYRDYAFKMYKRFDYTPQECLNFHQSVQNSVVPLYRKLADERRAAMQLDALRPWDTQVDPKGRPPLKPFETADELCGGCERIFTKLYPKLAEQFKEMRAKNELDLDSRVGKAPGGYLYCRDEMRRPFIFMNAAGLQRDVETLLHESGHAFHSIACRQEPLNEYRNSPIEFAEVASMSMELFADDLLTEFYSAEDAQRAKRKHLEGVIGVLPWIACIDEFQHWIYTHPKHTTAERTAYWLGLDEKYGIQLDWSGYENIREFTWQRQLHLFVHPFYYIEYGIAQLGALQLWSRFKENPVDAIERYLAGLKLGGAKPLPQLFETAGARFDFSLATIEPLMQKVEDELAGIPV